MIKRLVSLTGASFFPIALISRLPFAMMVVGVLTLVVAVHGSLLLGGVNSALVGAGTAVVGPFVGAVADRIGQRRVLLVLGILNAIFLALFVWIVWSSLPVWVMFLSAFFVGASAPQTSSMSRSRLIGFVNHGFTPQTKERALNSVMAYESTVDEFVFVFGPFIVGLLAVGFGPSAPVIGASILTLVFVTAFALHPSAKPPVSAVDRAATLAPVSELFRPQLIIVVVGIFGMGTFFGSMLTSLTAFMQELDGEARTGILYGIMGLGSAVLALSVGFFSPAFTKRWRWLSFSVLMIIGAFMVRAAETEPEMMVALAIIGLGIGPILVTQYGFGADRSPNGRNITVMTTLGSSIIVGQSLSSAITGWVSENLGVDAALLMPMVSVAIITAAGIANYFMTTPGKDYSQKITTI